MFSKLIISSSCRFYGQKSISKLKIGDIVLIEPISVNSHELNENYNEYANRKFVVTSVEYRIIPVSLNEERGSRPIHQDFPMNRYSKEFYGKLPFVIIFHGKEVDDDGELVENWGEIDQQFMAHPNPYQTICIEEQSNGVFHQIQKVRYNYNVVGVHEKIAEAGRLALTYLPN